MHSYTVIVILLVAIVGIVVGGSDVASCSDGNITKSVSLREALFCNYDRKVRPVKNYRTTTNVSVFLFLKFLYFKNQWDSLKLHSLTVWRWRDEFLTWNTSEHNSENSDLEGGLRVNTEDIWVPDVEVFTISNMASSSVWTNQMAVVKSDGNITLVAPTVNSVRCVADVRKWPFDIQNCTMRMGSWTHKTQELNLTLSASGFSTMSFSPNRDWNLVAKKAELRVESVGNMTYQTAIFTLILQRHSGMHAVYIFIPSIVLSILTLVIFWLDAGSKERLFLIYINMLCHFLCLQYLGKTLIQNGHVYPLILIFFRDSLCLVLASLIITLIVRKLDSVSGPPPAWITTVTNGVLASLPEMLIMLIGLDVKEISVAVTDNQLTDNGVATSPKSAGWRLFATLLDRVLFIVFFITLVILLFAFVS